VTALDDLFADGDDLILERDVAEVFKLKKTTVRSWRYSNYGPASIKVGRSVRYRRSVVREWLLAQTSHPHPLGSAAGGDQSPGRVSNSPRDTVGRLPKASGDEAPVAVRDTRRGQTPAVRPI
jgi:predicted DNA-binding transcriptional regulator AlpA